MKPWHIFYDDGTVFTNAQTHSLDVPNYGVICIVQKKLDGQNHILHGTDFYLFVDDSWIAVDKFGALDHLMHKLESIKCAISGRTVTNDLQTQILNKAKQYVRGVKP